MANTLLDKLKKSGTIDAASVLTNSIYFASKEMVTTDIPIINAAFSGDINGGLVSGVTVIAGESKSFKTLLSLYCIKAYMNKYPEAVCLFYDCEFGTPTAYMKNIGIDTDRVIHIPVTNIEELNFDLVKRLGDITREDKVCMLIDSIGNLASKKEYENALSENGAKDMTRAQALKGLFRLITPHITMKDIPCIVINHVYANIGSFTGGYVVQGGSGPLYSANTVFVITKAQEKEGTELVGWNYTINIEKSRFVKEKSKLKFQVYYGKGINKFSGLLDIALESGDVIKPSQGWYSRVNTDTGEVEDKKYRAKDINNDEFWREILERGHLNEYVKSKYQLCFEEDIQEDI